MIKECNNLITSDKSDWYINAINKLLERKDLDLIHDKNIQKYKNNLKVNEDVFAKFVQ